MTPTHSISADEARRLLAEDREMVTCAHCHRRVSKEETQVVLMGRAHHVCRDEASHDDNGFSWCVRFRTDEVDP